MSSILFLQTQLHCRLLSYRELSGFTASDIAKSIVGVPADLDVDMTLMRGFTADASVMGTRRAFGTAGSNVFRYLQDQVPLRMLNSHCAGHRIQLAVSNAIKVDQYLLDVDRTVRGLFRWLRAHPHGKVDLCFRPALPRKSC